MTEAGAERIVDLCSGGAGPVVAVARALANEGSTIPFVLTDLYPNELAFEEAVRAAGGTVEFETRAIDAMRVPANHRGMSSRLRS